MGRSVTPAGWPKDLPPPESDEFDERVVPWLLDRAPPGFRTAPSLRTHPTALGLLVLHTATGEVEALRAAYASARRELSHLLPPAQLDGVLADIEAQGAASVETRRQVDLVISALAGARWRERL